MPARKLKADLPYRLTSFRGPPSRGVADWPLNSCGQGAKFREQGLSAEQKHPDWEEQGNRSPIDGDYDRNCAARVTGMGHPTRGNWVCRPMVPVVNMKLSLPAHGSRRSVAQWYALPDASVICRITASRLKDAGR